MTVTINGTTGVSLADTNAVPTAAIQANAVTQAKLATGISGTGPAFSAYPSSNQNLTNNTWTKLQMNQEDFDTASCYDTTNYRFTPNVAGYYQITGSTNFSANATNTRFLSIYKNGTIHKVLQVTVPNSINYMNIGGSCLIYFNGSTDYVELYALQNSGSTLATSADQAEMYFQGALVRAA